MIDVTDIRTLLPHRYPMLLVDRVTELVAGSRITAIKAVTCNEPWYARLTNDDDHGYPEMLLVESWMQAAGLLILLAPGRSTTPGEVMLAGRLSGVEFHRQVLPGDVLRHDVRMVKDLAHTVMVEGECTVDGAPVLTVSRALLAFRPEGAVQW
ncbi:3-hydroxyacyl-ACP dehydratase FabZ family protein [Lentzea sp. NPDC051213]|uniref:3-hydroxyacyl-ACP dehydratase FabZ family protein n=1 Tax=Lentzea sp. NPDC051213 TaxID=3364126 RepID=UPI00379982A0